MAQPRLTGKFTTTLNLISGDVDVARKLAEARGVSTASVLREAVRLGLPRLIERDQEYLDAGLALQLSLATAPEPATRRKNKV